MKALIVYASKTGVTEDVAGMMAKRLGEDCALYDCRKKRFTPAQPGTSGLPANLDLPSCDLVVIGTPIYMGRPMRRILGFCAAQQGVLARKKLAFFTCGAGTAEEDKPCLWKRLPESLLAAEPGYYHMGGEIREHRLNPLMRFAMRAYKKSAAREPAIDLEQIAAACEAFTRRLGT